MTLAKSMKNTYRVFKGKREGESPLEISWVYGRIILK